MAEANCDLLLGTTSLRGITGLYVASWDALWLEAPYRGGTLTIPYTAGATSFTKVRDAYVMDFPVVITAGSKSAQLAVLAAVQTAIGSDNLLTLTRRLPTDTSGTTADTTCSADYLGGTALAQMNWVTGRTTLSFVNLSGGWA